VCSSDLLNELLFNYTHAYGKDNAATLDIEGGISVRTGRGNFTLFDHQIYHGTALLQHDFSDVANGELEYLFQAVRFNSLSDFNYFENKISGQYNTTLSSKTSVTLRSDFGIKIYSSQTISATDTTITGSGLGEGWGGQTGAQMYSTTQTSTPTVTQLSGMGRIAQSIFEGTGIALSGQYQWNIRKESRYLYGIIPDDVVFDDHYGYEGLMVSVMLTQVLPFESHFRISAAKQNRIYSTLPAYDIASTLVADKREDTRYLYTFQLEKDFEEQGISIDLTFDHIDNISNDAFYDYKNNALTLGVSWLIY
jgi:hypothetical protein